MIMRTINILLYERIILHDWEIVCDKFVTHNLKSLLMIFLISLANLASIKDSSYLESPYLVLKTNSPTFKYTSSKKYYMINS